MGKIGLVEFEKQMNERADARTKAAIRTLSDEHAQLGSFMEEFRKSTPTKKEMSAGFDALNDTVVRESARNHADRSKKAKQLHSHLDKVEENLSNKIREASRCTLSAVDKLIILIVTLLAGVGGWLLSQNAIKNGMAPYVKMQESTVIDYIKDAAGNVVDITATTSTSVAQVYTAPIVLTIVLSMIIAFALSSYILQMTGGDENEEK